MVAFWGNFCHNYIKEFAEVIIKISLKLIDQFYTYTRENDNQNTVNHSNYWTKCITCRWEERSEILAIIEKCRHIDGWTNYQFKVAFQEEFVRIFLQLVCVTLVKDKHS